MSKFMVRGQVTLSFKIKVDAKNAAAAARLVDNMDFHMIEAQAAFLNAEVEVFEGESEKIDAYAT